MITDQTLGEVATTVNTESIWEDCALGFVLGTRITCTSVTGQ